MISFKLSSYHVALLFDYKIVFIFFDQQFQVFLHAVELSPDVGHSKYMYLGQIHSGQEAVDYYTRGIDVLLSALNKQTVRVSNHTHSWFSLHQVLRNVTVFGLILL